MYRTIDAKFWTDPKVRQLSTNNKLLFLYFITSPHAHFSGLYYLPSTTTSHETGIKLAEVTKGIDTLSKAGIIMADTLSELVWVVNMFRYQSHSVKLIKNIEKHLSELHNSPLIGHFLGHYSELDIPYQYPIDPLSDKEQEQEKEQKKGKDKLLLVENDSTDLFEIFWKEFLAMKRNDGKVATRKAWITTTVNGRPGKENGHKPVDPSVIIQAAKNYRAFCEAEGTEARYIKQPAAFLGPDRHWEDWEKPRKASAATSSEQAEKKRFSTEPPHSDYANVGRKQ